MPEIKNQIKRSLSSLYWIELLKITNLVIFSLAKDINDIIFEYFKLYEEEKI